ncbi:MAG: NrsF family protein [Alphaproteobacteria bacterium]
MSTEQFLSHLEQQGAAKPLPHPLLVAVRWVVLLLLYMLLVLAITTIRPDIDNKLTEVWFVAELAIMLATSCAAIFSASYLALPDCGQKPWLRFAPLLSITIMLVALAFFMMQPGAMTLSECLRAGEYDCIVHLIVFSIVPVLLLFAALSKSAPVLNGWAGAMIGLAAGSMGYTILRLTEASDDAIILAVWHMLPVAVITGCCVLIGRSILGRWSHTTA